jgi:methyltransferase-like protein/cyclopropane fatty-acyl-phospholipid synthase-like methyltransferase
MSTVPQTPSVSSPGFTAASGDRNTYDAIPYCSFPVAASHPDRMFNTARLFGLDPVLPENARVLELGCAGGGNLIPLASQFPDASFVGVELSKVQCEYANSAIKFVGLTNIVVHQASITDISAEFGKFDYIICHGVFSWVPDFVSEAILRVASENLTDRGVVYISYNTLPGWYFRGMLRGIMQQHVQGIEDMQTKIVQARALLKFLAEANENSQAMHAVFLRSESAFFDKQPDQYVFHEYLEEFNKPYYFKEFVQKAFKHGLQFLGESNLASTWINNLSKSAAAKLASIDDSVTRGHYMDCITNRTFRETLLVPTHASINRSLSTNLLTNIRFVGQFTEVEKADGMTVPKKESEKRYTTSKGGALSTPDRSTQLAVEVLNKTYPGSVSLEELCLAIEDGLARESLPTAVSREQLATAMMHWTLSGWIDFRFLSDRLKVRDLQKPKVSSWTRSQARASDCVTNLQHQLTRISGVERLIIPLLDGTRDLDAITSEIALLARTGAITLESTEKGRNSNEPDLHRTAANQLVDQLAQRSFFLADY